MKRTEVTVSTRDGVCPSILFKPDGDGPWPGVIMFMDAGGVRPALVGMAEQLSAAGYVVLLPELYYRHGSYTPFEVETVFSVASETDRLMSMVHSVSQPMAISDTSAFLEFLLAQPDVAGAKVATTGYCMGGRFSLTAAGNFPDQIAAAASFHGAALATEAPDSPHLMVGNFDGMIYVAAAENDGTFPPEQAELLEQTLTESGVAHTIETYPAAHGFAVPDNPTYDEAAAKRHWQALNDLLEANLTS